MDSYINKHWNNERRNRDRLRSDLVESEKINIQSNKA